MSAHASTCGSHLVTFKDPRLGNGVTRDHTGLPEGERLRLGIHPGLLCAGNTQRVVGVAAAASAAASAVKRVSVGATPGTGPVCMAPPRTGSNTNGAHRVECVWWWWCWCWWCVCVCVSWGQSD